MGSILKFMKSTYRKFLRFYYTMSSAPKPKCINQKGKGKVRIAILGIYLSDKPNKVKHLISRLSKSNCYHVEQHWAHLGPENPKGKVAQYVRITQNYYKSRMELLNNLAGMIDLEHFDYVIITDDDIVIQNNFIDAFLGLQIEFDLALAQPALTKYSWTYHPIVRQKKQTHVRLTNFVEIGPMFSVSQRLIPFIFPFDTITSMGWGLNYVWPITVKKQGLRMGIIDATPVDHSLRRPGNYYDNRIAFRQMEKLLAKYEHINPENGIVEICGLHSNLIHK